MLTFAVTLAFKSLGENSGITNRVWIAIESGMLFIVAATLVPSMWRGKRAAPRKVLHQLWRTYRVGFGASGLIELVACIQLAVDNTLNEHFRPVPHSVFLCSMLLCGLLLSASVRGRIIRELGRLGNKGNTTMQEAAAVAALIGGGTAEDALQEGSHRCRALPLSALRESDLTSSADTGLFERSVPTRLGDIDAFVSQCAASRHV